VESRVAGVKGAPVAGYEEEDAPEKGLALAPALVAPLVAAANAAEDAKGGLVEVVAPMGSAALVAPLDPLVAPTPAALMSLEVRSSKILMAAA
jgi:hypothetical protein